MILISLFLLLIYVLTVSMVIYHWVVMPNSGIEIQSVGVTVLVPVRNEEKGIECTLNSILSNDYCGLEIIVINDHSTDDTVAKIQSIASEKIKLVHLDQKKNGKKAAITKGVTIAKNDLIICTDGDTQVSKYWLKEHVSGYQLGNKLSFGPVVYESNSFWVDVLNLELAALVGVGGASVHAGEASMINGCNYSFSKSAFESVNGFEGNENIPTGDDEFLLRKVKFAYPKSITFLKSKRASVITEPVNSVKQLINQRRRWASKWKYHTDLGSKILPVYLFFLYASLLVTPWFLVDGYWQFFFIGLAIKSLIDFILLYVVSKITEVKISFFVFLALEIIYPIYVVFFGLASNFGSYRWQGRSYHV